MVYVTHDQEEALALGDRVLVLNKGSLLQVDTPEHLYTHPAHRFVAGFLGSPPMSLLDGELVEREGRLVLVNGLACWTVPACREGEWRPYAGRAVTIGIRPEQVRLRPLAGAHREGVVSAREGEAPAEPLGPPTWTDEPGLVMRVVLVERSGPDSLITLEQDQWQVLARLPGGFPAVRTLVGVSWDPWQVSLFERETGWVLAPGAGEQKPLQQGLR